MHVVSSTVRTDKNNFGLPSRHGCSFCVCVCVFVFVLSSVDRNLK